jgi:hypothetical protein
MIQAEDAAGLVQDKKDFWNCCERNGFFMPDFNTTIITLDFLRDVRYSLVYCPRYADLKLGPCPEPPTLFEATLELISAIENNYVNMSAEELPKFQKLVEHLIIRSSNRPWVLQVLSTLT